MSALGTLALLFGAIIAGGTLLVVVNDALERRFAGRGVRVGRPARARRAGLRREVVPIAGLVDPARAWR